MGLWDTVKGWFNIGGVTVKLKGVPQQFSRSGSSLGGQLQLTSKSDKHVLKIDYKLLLKRTTGSGDNKETKEHVLGETQMDQPFDMKKDETKTLDFTIPYSVETALKDMGGVLGALGKLGAFASGEKDEYFVVAECDVKGAAFDPTDSVKVTITD